MIFFDSVYGTRRSETCGLRWKAIDFDNNQLTINHTVVSVKGKDGSKELLKKDRTKNKSSYRTFPLTPEIREMFFQLKEQQKHNRELFCNGYIMDDAEYDMLYCPSRLSAA